MSEQGEFFDFPCKVDEQMSQIILKIKDDLKAVCQI